MRLFSTMLTVLIMAGLPLPAAAPAWNPEAAPEAVVQREQVRFTILTPSLIRLEWNPGGHFIDASSLVFVNRRLPVPRFQTDESGGWLSITTSHLLLRYRLGSGAFSATNLSITLTMNGRPVIWKPGLADPDNLRGTTRTLDGWTGGSIEKLEPGLLSRSGWALVDDTGRHLLDRSPWPWVQPRPAGGLDWYFFGYGHRYRECLADFIRIAGAVPIPPLFAFGYWWSRYWVYSDSELRSLTGEMRSRGLPVDVLIIDMDWHLTYGLNWQDKRRDPFGQRIGWTGYTWNRALFPEPAEFLQWTGRQKLKTALNLHPASGIAPFEEKYREFAARLGTVSEPPAYIPYAMDDKNFAETFFEVLLAPMEKDGVDFWWLDWQQWLESKTIPGLNNTWWLNYTFFTRMERAGLRPLLFHRWGGLGNHRYQIGFSGDTTCTWESLAFQPYFTATAANVAYGYWSHDIGGHEPLARPTDPELYLRWLQWGVFSPVLRTHCTKSSLAERRLWMFPEHFPAMREALHLRYSLAPYLYSAARQTHLSGVSICHPLYYDYPDTGEAYQYTGQYLFGPSMLVAPVTAPANPGSGLAEKSIWLPPGLWFEWASGTLLSGGKTVTRNFALDEIPVYLRAGSIIPRYPPVTNLQEPPDRLILTICPGGDGQTEIYQDDTTTPAYQSGEYGVIPVASRWLEDGALQVAIGPRQGFFSGQTSALAWEIQLPAAMPPASVSLNGSPVLYSPELREGCWTYDGRELTVHLLTPVLPCDRSVTAMINWSGAGGSGPDRMPADGKAGQFRRLARAAGFLKEKIEGDYFLPDWFYSLVETPARITCHPERAAAELTAFQEKYSALSQDLTSLELGDPALIRQVLAHLSRNPASDK